MAVVKEKTLKGIASFDKSETNYFIRYKTGEYATLSILNNHVFRYYMSPTGLFLDYPTPINDDDDVKINIKSVQEYGRHAFDYSVLEQSEHHYIVHTTKLRIQFDKSSGVLAVHDKRNDKEVLKEREPIHYSDHTSKQTLHQTRDEYFFGGGMQHGRFTHKGETIYIDRTNDWMDGGVISPNPFYWSTRGYGVLRNTWQKGTYDFGSKDQQFVETAHDDHHFDAFYFISPLPKDILNDYFELTGRPIKMTEYAFYIAHIDTFNKTYWYQCGYNSYRTIYFSENSMEYEAYQDSTINGQIGILGSLNGDKTQYEFSARHMIDWYKLQDMPLGWFIPNNDSGYGQTDSFVGDLENLKNFTDYAKENNVEVALWIDTSLEPKDREHPVKGERDLGQEVNVGIVALKCECEGKSAGLKAVENATKIFVNTSENKVRPFILLDDGWAGVQRYAGISSGAQTGGLWEYIRFLIPTLIGAGLSGLPVVGSDVNGIYGGGDAEIFIREYQWKTFTPLQLDTDGFGRDFKVPFINCFEANEITRAYLKLRSMLLPYNYSISHESIQGLPMMRAMFLEFPNESPSYTKDSQYQFMWGPSILVAPLYANPEVHCNPEFIRFSGKYVADHDFIRNVPVRNGVYLPDSEQVWIDLFTGDRYQGGKIYNNIKTPIWKIPVFVKDGAIIPLVNANNNPSEINRDCRIFLLYINGDSMFKIYEDDGKSLEYLEHKYAQTTISIHGPVSNESGNVSVYIHKTTGTYSNLVKERRTVLQIMASKNVEKIRAVFNKKDINIAGVKTKEEFEKNDNVYLFDEKFTVNPYLEEYEKHTNSINEKQQHDLYQKFLRIKIEKIDVTVSDIEIKIEGFSNKGDAFGSNSTVIENLKAPKFNTPIDKDVAATSIALRWEVNDNASYYEIERDGRSIFSNILGYNFTFKDFDYESKHAFRIRSVNKAGVSKWSSTMVTKTKEKPCFRGIVKDVIVSCSKSCEYQHEVGNLIKNDRTWWHTDWSSNYRYFDPHEPREQEKITLFFDLNDVYEISKVEYVPREDAGNGTFLKIQYRHSIDGKKWTGMTPVICWDCDESTKVIDMDGAKFRHFEIDVIESASGDGSGRNIFFYKI